MNTSSPALSITLFVRKARLFRIAQSCVEHAVGFLLAAGVLFCLWAFTDALFSLPLFSRRIFFHVAGTAAAFCILRFLWVNKPSVHTATNTILFVQQKLPLLRDELLSAWQLSTMPPPGVSSELIAAHEAITLTALSKHKPGDVFSLMRLREKAYAFPAAFLLASLLCFAAAPSLGRSSYHRILCAMAPSEWDRWFTVLPGSSQCLLGKEVRLSVAQKQHFPGEPVVQLRAGAGEWHRVELTETPSANPELKSFGYTIDQLTSGMEYTVAWGDWESPVFTLTPLTFPQLGEFSVTYRYPDYTGLPEQTIRGNPHIAAPAGTAVALSAKTQSALEKAQLFASWGLRYPVQLQDNTVSAHFTVRQTGNYYFSLETKEGLTDPEPPRYMVTVTADTPPEIELLSPTEDLLVSPDAELPLVIQAHDDFGLTGIELVCHHPYSHNPVPEGNVPVSRRILMEDRAAGLETRAETALLRGSLG